MKALTLLKAIRRFCLECCGASAREVELCTANPEEIRRARLAGDDTEYSGCPLYRWRFGRRPQTIAKIRQKATTEGVFRAGSDFSRGGRPNGGVSLRHDRV